MKITERDRSRDIDRDAEPYKPGPGEIAGFELCAWKVKGGIQLGSTAGLSKGKIMKDFPHVVHLNGVDYTLEAERWQANGFGWGVYV